MDKPQNIHDTGVEMKMDSTEENQEESRWASGFNGFFQEIEVEFCRVFSGFRYQGRDCDRCFIIRDHFWISAQIRR